MKSPVLTAAPSSLNPQPAFQTRELTTFEQLLELREEWSGLWERCPDATPFQSPQWLLPWWRHLGRGRLWALTLHRDEHLVGFAPLFVERYFGLPVRRLGLLGTGHTDYLDVLLEPEFAADAAAHLLRYLAEHARRWDFCDFQQLRSGSPLLTADTPAGVHSRSFAQEVCPVLPLPGSAAELHGGLPGKLRSNIRYYRRRIAREDDGDIEGPRIAAATEETLPESLRALFRLHQARWNQRLLPGAFAGARVRAFHQEATREFRRQDWLRLYTLTFRGQPRGALYCFQCRKRGYYYSGGFDPEIGALSPGTVLIAHALEAAIADGATEFDFLRGNEPYKYTWGASDRVNYRRLLWNDTLAGRLAPGLNVCERQVEYLAKSTAHRLAEQRSRSRARNYRTESTP